ncbi:hypothetical protein ACHQM5_023539 [Ranunculus cassubicifolius]
MGFTQFSVLSLIVLSSFIHGIYGARKLSSLYEPPPMLVSYHKGALLEGKLPVSILWYGRFSPSQKSIVADFLLSLNPTKPIPSVEPSVSLWWKTVGNYMKKAGKKETQIVLSTQLSIENYPLGKMLKKSQITELTEKVNSELGSVILVLTDKDVTVEGFCMSNCGFHGSNAKKNSAFIWVGNSETQCPGQCAWPFHQPIYGPQTVPLVAPNGDVGLDGMVVNIASLLAGTVTNPFGNGYYQGSSGAYLEAASMCPGVYGKGAYPGYAGDLLKDSGSGGSYNAQGVNGRKYLLPAIFDPSTSTCSTMV